MSRLSDRISEAVRRSRGADGFCRVADVVASVKPTLTEDDKADLAEEALAARAKRLAERGFANLAKSNGAQGEFPFTELHAGYALERARGADLERIIKPTELLSRLELREIITIREKQVEDDSRHLEQLRLSEIAAGPVWDRHPDWTFGQVCSELVRCQPAAGVAA